MDIRKYGIMIAVAILTAIFAYSVADAIAPQQEWDNCYEYPQTYVGDGYNARPYVEKGLAGNNCSYVPVDEELRTSCQETEGTLVGIVGNDGCVQSYECSYCEKENQERQEQRSAIIFYIMVGLGLIAIVAGFMLPLGSIHEWVGVGFILGGVISLFVGTISHWGNLARFARPFVIALELAIVLFIVYRKMRNDAPDAPIASTKPAIRKSRRGKR